MYKETTARSLAKALSWRICGTILIGFIVYFFTEDVRPAIAVGAVDFIAKILFYFMHERLWNLIRFGKQRIEPAVFWLTGLPGSGKTSIAEKLVQSLQNKGFHVELLDGDIIRSVFPKTGFSREERDTHIKRIGYLASRLEKNGVFVVAALISPYRDSRRDVRSFCRNFIEVYVSTPLSTCESRDTKGLYRKARKGEIQNFTGVSDPYEPPQNAEVIVDASTLSAEDAAKRIFRYLKKIS